MFLDRRRILRFFASTGFVCLAGFAVSCVSSRLSPFSREDKVRLAGYWEQYLTDDPEWPSIRGQWLGEGELSAGVLVENVLVEYIASYDRSDLARHERARTELVALAPTSIPYLIEALRPAEDIVRKQLSGVLSLIGDPAVSGLLELLEEPDGAVRRTVVVTLGKIGSPSAGVFLRSMLASEPDWRVRSEIPAALVRAMGQDSYDPLNRALEQDSDSFVRRRIITALVSLNRREAAGPLVGALQRATDRLNVEPGPAEDEMIGLLKEIRHLGQALTRLTGKKFGVNTQQWVSWWGRRG